jgi:hypothetical protein
MNAQPVKVLYNNHSNDNDPAFSGRGLVKRCVF